MTTARNLIDATRIRHWSFIDVQLADGAAVLWLNQRQHQLLLKYRDSLRGQVGSSVDIAAVVNGSLVGINANGTPTYTTTVADGYPISFNVNGTPYIDLTQAPVARDPYGANGGTPGWPLPTDMIAFLAMTATDTTGYEWPVRIVDELQRLHTPQGRPLTAFISSNRIVPIRPPTPLVLSDLWSTVTSVRLAYIGVSTIATIDDAVVMPTTLIEPLVAGLAELFANQSRNCTVAERQQFANAARRAENDLMENALDVLGDLQLTQVLFKG